MDYGLFHVFSKTPGRPIPDHVRNHGTSDVVVIVADDDGKCWFYLLPRNTDRDDFRSWVSDTFDGESSVHWNYYE